MAKFEESIKELEKIVKTLEDGEPSLDESLKNFEKGITLIKVCQKELESAENKIKELTEDGDTKPFDSDNS
ncbi:MAG: exodeoxyribonuclease VII small subunit [Gammaproteobacteria bacterium]|jgi:exodeoxyribonuclease VII small subunit|uniref:Exodeoxyribonuclease 7 small subunit n=1 Tax=SAR86 cluster bacterium TaxID=2030880 RepID=A0A520MTH0_9GAMM|nr:exodeoxyribonuclease VII small subunit [Gammaproteobacteria bacterium]RZO24508.1 MAG: exodeoxyribonuclease VII small subunit [SAR86 cluster bacterium]|tara:strand:+ start:420 stop:632 length:213 start_codon:yes stop_codon:yes gene_type:complete